MCILCVIQKWSRRIATMLPWLVIPLIGLWALSQLLPPAFRFEITSSRLACVLVLLVTLFWYEVLMPQLSAWQIRRDAKVRERKRSEAIELQKLRKTATRRCRNCYTAYRDQNPGGGKFMCSYCGHVSKRPVLDLPVLPGMNNSGILKDLVSKGGKILNGKAWSDNGWMCRQELLENGSWSTGPFVRKSGSYWQKNCGDLFSGEDEHCLTERSYSRIFVFACKALTRTFFWRKLFRVSSSGDAASVDTERRGMLDNCGENGVTGQESRGEKARRKAEEKRLARLEKELLEEEERKQREEVARLVEERRRLRDEEMEAEKEHGKGVSRVKAGDGKKESERKRREKKKEKDRGSSISNSDAEEVEKRTSKDSERNKSENDRQEQHRTAGESLKSHAAEVGPGLKVAAASNHNRLNAGTRYFDRMRGTFLSSSRAFTGSGFFGKSVNASTVSREHKHNTLVETTQLSTFGKDSGRTTTNGDNKSAHLPVLVEAQPSVASKKSWQQLFTRSSAVSLPPSSNVISRPTGKSKAVQSPSVSDYPTSTQLFDNPINFGLSSPFSLPSFSFGSSGNGTAPSLSSEPMHSKTKDLPHQFFPEEPEIFEDPCYDPDPISLLGPVSESLDEFQQDLGYVPKAKPSEITKPSPIESPFSRSRVSEERHPSSFPFPGTTNVQDYPNNISNTGTWQMWNTTPLVQDGLGLIGGPSSWLLHPEKNNKEDIMYPVPQRTMASLFKNDEQASSRTRPPQNVPLGSFQNGGKTFNDPVHAITGDPWLPETLFGPALIHENQVLLKSNEEVVQNDLIYGNPSDSATNSWDKNDWAVQGSREASRPPAGSFYLTTDVQSLWSRN